MYDIYFPPKLLAYSNLFRSAYTIYILFRRYVRVSFKMIEDSPHQLYVIKRDGRQEEVKLEKFAEDIQKLCYGLNSDFVNSINVTRKVVNGLYSGMSTSEIVKLAAEKAAMMSIDHPDYAILAARIAISYLHKETKDKFSDVIDALYNVVNQHTKKRTPLISDAIYEIVMNNTHRLNSSIIYDRDFSYNYFSLKILEHSYLLKVNGKIMERPQHMLMRVAVGIHGEDINGAIETYNLMSEGFFMPTSSTLFLAGTLKPHLSSCFLLTTPEDSIEGFCKSLTQCACISKATGDVGLSVQDVRAKGTSIAGINGVSNGIVPMLRVFNSMAQFVWQGSNKQPGAFTIYIEPWHADIFEFLNLKKTIGKEELRARDLSYALWIPDLFMTRVEKDEVWSLMCPHLSPKLSDCWGEEFEHLYEQYEREGMFIRQVPAQELWKAIILSQADTGMPYMLYKDTCNRKSNQQNLGTIKGSNLCGEIIEYTAPDEIAVCNLASIAINKFIKPDSNSFDFEKLKEVTKVVAINLDKIIDINYYPVPEARTSNMRHRPIGIGVKGLADVFILLHMPFDSEEAQLLNREIFETIYYGALEASCELAKRNGPYSTYKGSPVSKGILQYDMWNVNPTKLWNWGELKGNISRHGVRNSMLVALMPAASTTQILGNNESIEPYTSYVHTKRILLEECQVINNYLVKDLIARGLWDDIMKNQILDNYGSIQNIPGIPHDLKAIYKTAWEISQKTILNMAVERGAFIDQSQSLNIHLEKPTYSILTSVHFYGWRRGLKTGMYYVRTKPKLRTTQFTVDKSKLITRNEQHSNGFVIISEDEQQLETKGPVKKRPEESGLASLVSTQSDTEESDYMYHFLLLNDS